jgi:hypothetical protein
MTKKNKKELSKVQQEETGCLNYLFMKNFLLPVLLCTFAFSTCKKDKAAPEGNYFGYAKAEINGVSVNYNKANGALLYNLNDSISLNFEKWDGSVLKESISIQKIYKGTNLSQRIYKYDYTETRIKKLSSGYYTLRDDGDVVCDLYNIYEPDSLQNYIIISSYNPQTKEIRGTFQATYLIDSARVATIGKCRATAPDTIRIRNGEFYTKIF